jgi:diguanylate cyclase (GGDEF)-like protein/PAS domain S-box-containing protein
VAPRACVAALKACVQQGHGDVRVDGPELLQAIVDSPTRHAIIVTDADGLIRIWNKGAARIFLYADEEIIGVDARALFSQDDLARGVPDQEMAHALRDGCAGDFRWHVRKDGTLFWADGMIYPVRSRGGKHLGFVKILRDATQEKQSGEATSRLALEDSLTGLANRAEFRNRFVDMAASAQRHSQSLVLMLIDLDRFKDVNDRLGHAAGDALLQQAAHRMRAVVRDTDFIARFGGDEFVVLLPDAQSPEEGGAAAEKLVATLSRPFHISEREVQIGASIGLAAYPQDAPDLDQLLMKADLALYRAKAAGRGVYRFYSAQMDAGAHRHNLEHVQLRRAVKDRAFTLHYQPQVEAMTGKVLAVEALLRCSDPFFSGYPIEKLLALAVETGRMRRLGLWALSESVKQVRQWQRLGWPDLRLTVNFCRIEFTDSRFAQRVLELLARMDVAPGRLDIDIPETQLTKDMDAGELIELARNGVSITIDDLGAGGLSLEHLLELPIRTAKLDLRFVPDIPTDPRSCAIATCVFQLARTLGIRVVAERVETEQQAAFLRTHCDAMLGFHFARPMTAAGMTAWLQANDAMGSTACTGSITSPA